MAPTSCVGQPAALTVTNPIDGYDYVWSTDPEGNNILGTGITFSPTLNGPATYYVRGVVSQQSVIDFSYTGSVQTWAVPAGVTEVQLEVWGAQGGTYSSYPGGLGGYDPEGQNLVYEGSEFITPALDATTTYYLQTVEVPLVNVPYDFTYTGSVQSWP